jgi:uncharacterized ferredoxin-like protein
MEGLENAARTILELMAASARTAPKGGGQDFIDIMILDREQCQKVGDYMIEMAKTPGRHNFDRDGQNIKDSHGMLMLGLREHKGIGLECGACGWTCGEMSKAEGRDFKGPNCSIRSVDLGIALGSAVKTASLHNADNRIMYRAGVAIRKMKLMESQFVHGIPISLTGKSPYFDR